MRVFLNPWGRLIGPNRYLLEMLRPLPELRQGSLVVLPPGSDAAEEYRELGLRVETWPEIELVRSSLRPGSLFHLLGAHSLGLARLRRRLAALGPSLVVSNGENLWVGGMAARLLRVPHAQVFHTLGFENRLGRHPVVLRTYLRIVSAWSLILVGVSGAVIDALTRGRVAGGKLRRVPNPVPTARLTSAAAPLPPVIEELLKEHRPLLLCGGHLSPMKGQDLLVEALPRMVEKHPRLLCLFAGRRGAATGLDDTVEFERRLLRAVRNRGLEGHVRFLGYVPELPALLHRVDLCVQPSRTESFGRVVAEALVCGTPVAAFAVGGIPEVVGGGAFLARCGDPAALADAALEALSRPEEAARRTRAGRDHVVREFDSELVARRFASLIAELEAA